MNVIPVIIILCVVLVLLLIDWPKLLKRLPFLAQLAKRIQESPVKTRRERLNPDQPSVPTVAVGGFGSQRVAGSATGSASFLNHAYALPADSLPKAESQLPEVVDILQKADVHFRKGEFKAAEDLYIQAAAKDPRCSKAYARLGVIYLENGEEWEDAEEAFRQALIFDPQNGFILNNLGLVLYHRDKYADAIRHFEQAVRQDEYNANRQANLGKAYMAMRQYAKAESAFKKALKLEPNEMEYKDLLAEAIEKKTAHKQMIRR